MYRTIVVGTDCSSTADRAVERASELARATGAVLHVVSAYQEPVGAVLGLAAGQSVGHPEWTAAAFEDVKRRVKDVVAQLCASGVRAEAIVDFGDPSATLVAVARKSGADLIVVGDRGLKGLRRLLGSVPGAVARHAEVDVLVVHTT